MAIIQPDPGPMFREEIRRRLESWRSEQIAKLMEDYRTQLLAVASQFAINVERYYSLAENETNVVITLKLPK